MTDRAAILFVYFLVHHTSFAIHNAVLACVYIYNSMICNLHLMLFTTARFTSVFVCTAPSQCDRRTLW